MMTIRSKDESQPKEIGLKQSSFAFRRIQSRELYQPSQEADPCNRFRFRVRVQLIGRTH
jgi:hypothetical protein